MLTRRNLLTSAAVAAVSLASVRMTHAAQAAAAPGKITHTEDEWQKILTREQYVVLRREGTEIPFSSPLLHEKRSGRFACAGCELPLFSSNTKFESGTGWPSFWAPLDGAVATKHDGSLGMERVAVLCARCDGHLGHVFEDGPPPTGLRYCMNGLALVFVADAG